jgi:hypothetical protein
MFGQSIKDQSLQVVDTIGNVRKIIVLDILRERRNIGGLSVHSDEY